MDNAFEQSNGVPMLAGAGYGYATEAMVKMPTMKDRIASAVVQAEERLAAAKRAQEIFAKNPDLEELLNIMQRSHF